MYNASQARDQRGRWSSGGGSSDPSTEGGTKRSKNPTLRPTEFGMRKIDAMQEDLRNGFEPQNGPVANFLKSQGYEVPARREGATAGNVTHVFRLNAVAPERGSHSRVIENIKAPRTRSGGSGGGGGGGGSRTSEYRGVTGGGKHGKHAGHAVFKIKGGKHGKDR